MIGRVEKAISWLNKHEKWLIWGGAASFFGLISALCLAKYSRLGYNAIDLAYFNQVFWNFVRGHWFTQSIHPHLSLGDHAELLIPFLVPLYAVWQDPRMLLLLQAAALAFTAWPVWLLARTFFPRTDVGAFERLAPLFFVAAWLGGPLLQNIAFFEFHVLPFALAPLLFMLLAYRRSRPRAFVLWALVAMLVREDVALVVLMMSVIAWMERRSWFWRIAPAVLGCSWFAGAMALIKHFSPAGGYKFAVYYAWLGATPGAMIMTAAAHPLLVIGHVFSLANIEMIIGLLMPFAFLPILGWRWLPLALAPAAQMMLGASGGGEVTVETHYVTLFLPGLLMAAMDGYARGPLLLSRIARALTAIEARVMTAVLLLIAAAYSAVAYGPLPGAMAATAAMPGGAPEYRDAQEALRSLPSDASVATSYALLPLFSSRERLYSAHYLFLGVTQFGERPYAVPADLQYAVFDDTDLLAYHAQFPITSWALPRYGGGFMRLSEAVGAPVAVHGPFRTYERGTSTDQSMLQHDSEMLEKPRSIGPLTLLGVERYAIGGTQMAQTEWRAPMPESEDLWIEYAVNGAGGRAMRVTRSPLKTLAGFTDSKTDSYLLPVAIPTVGLPAGTYGLDFRVIRGDVTTILEGDRSVGLRFSEKETLGAGDAGSISISR
ncbi:MAG: hypothetical protein RLZZ324_290 [Candidatus Parcubacteria bacterium]|jgi:uncharacterized membrane protein